MKRERVFGALAAAGFALLTSFGISIALFNHQVEGQAGEVARRMAFLLIYGPVIAGAAAVSGIAGAQKTLPSALATAVGGGIVAAIPVALILFVFGSIGGLARFDHVEDFALQMLRDVAQAASPLLVCPIAAALGYAWSSRMRRGSQAIIDDIGSRDATDV